MATNAIELQGTLREDGTLLLDQRPDLPPGRVKVTVQAIADYKQTDVWQFFERIKAERAALGMAARSREEIDAYLAVMRDDDRRPLIEPVEDGGRRHGGQPTQEAG